MEKKKLIDELVSLRKEAIEREFYNKELVDSCLRNLINEGTEIAFKYLSDLLLDSSKSFKLLKESKITGNCSFQQTSLLCIARFIDNSLRATNSDFKLPNLDEIILFLLVLDSRNKLDIYGNIGLVMNKRLFSSKLLTIMAENEGLDLSIDNDKNVLTLSANVPTITDINKENIKVFQK